MTLTVSKCNEKVEIIMPTSDLLKVVNDTIEGQLSAIKTDVRDLTSSVDMRIEMIYKEHLWELGKFGPEQSNQFRTMKEFLFANLKKVTTSVETLDLHTNSLIAPIKEYAESTRNVLMEEVYPNVRRLQQADQRRLTSL